MKRTLSDIYAEIQQVAEIILGGHNVPEERIYRLAVESIEAQPTVEHKIAALRCFTRGRAGLKSLPEDLIILGFDVHQA
jgi:hypothetical protein